MTTSCVCLPAPVPGSRLPAASSGHRLPASGSVASCSQRWTPAVGCRIPASGHRARPAASGGPDRRPATGKRRPASRNGGRPNPAIPLEVCRPALPHVRPRGRFRRTSVSGVPCYHVRPGESFQRALVSDEPLCPWTSCTAGSLAKHGGMALVSGSCCALYGNVLGRESVICWH